MRAMTEEWGPHPFPGAFLRRSGGVAIRPPPGRCTAVRAEYRPPLARHPIDAYAPPQLRPASDNRCSVSQAKGTTTPACATEHGLYDAYRRGLP